MAKNERKRERKRRRPCLGKPEPEKLNLFQCRSSFVILGDLANYSCSTCLVFFSVSFV